MVQTFNLLSGLVRCRALHEGETGLDAGPYGLAEVEGLTFAIEAASSGARL